MTSLSVSRRSNSVRGSSTSQSSFATRNVSNNISNNDELKLEKISESLIFPFFHEISRKVVIPNSLNYLQILIQFFQAFSLTMFPASTNIWRKKPPTYIRALQCFTDLGMFFQPSFQNCIYCYVIIYIYCVSTIAFSIGTCIYFIKKRTFPHWQVFMQQLFYSILHPIFIVPTCFLCGAAVAETHASSSAFSISCLIFSLVFIIFLYFSYFVYLRFTTRSPYLSNSMRASWEYFVLELYNGSLGFVAFITPTSNAFSNWFIIFCALFNIILCLIITFFLRFLPGIKLSSNVFLQAATWASCAGSIVSIIHYFVDFPHIYMFLTPLIVLIVSALLYGLLIFPRTKRKVVQQLLPTKPKMKERDKLKIFDSLVFSSYQKAIMYIHIGVENMCPFCMDFSFFKYLLDNYQSQEITLAILQVVAFFPSELQFLSYCLIQCEKYKRNLTFFDNFLIYQIRKVHVIRQSSVSRDASRLLAVLEKSSHETISLVRGFWSEILHTNGDITSASLRYIRKSTITMNSSYLDALDQFPKSHGINDSYCRFLTEVLCDFRSAAKYTRRMAMIDSGKHIITDYSFRSFVNVFPQYLKAGIVDNHGAMKSKEQYNNMLSLSDSLPSYHIEAVEHLEDFTASIFTQGKLRIAIQAFIERSSLKSIVICFIMAFLTLVFAFVVTICKFGMMSMAFDSPSALLQSTTLTSRIISGMQYASIVSAGQIIQSLLNLSLADLICSHLSINKSDIPNGPNMFYSPYMMLHTLQRELVSNIEKELNLILRDPELHIVEVTLYSYFESNKFPFIKFRGKNLSDIAVVQMSLRQTITFFSNELETVTSLGTYDPQNNDDLIPKTLELMLNGILITQNFFKIFNGITKNGVKHCEENIHIINAVMIVACILLLVVFISVRVINFKILYSDMHTISELLRNIVDEDNIEYFKNPIYLKNPKPLPQGTIHSGHDFSLEMYLHPFFVLLSILLAVFLFFMICLFFYNGLKNAENTFKWAETAAKRFTTILTVLLGIIIENSHLGIDFNISKNQNNYMSSNEIFRYHHNLNVGLIGRDMTIDNIFYLDSCEKIKDHRTFNIANFLDCLSLNNRVDLGASYFYLIKHENHSRVFYSQEFAGVLFIVDKYLYSNLREFQDYLLTFSDDNIADTMGNMFSYDGIGLCIFTIIFICECISINLVKLSYDAFKQLIMSLPPFMILKNVTLMNFLYGNRSEKNCINLSTNEVIIESSDKATLNIAPDLTIQGINSAVWKLTGITPDQLLGRPITWLIPVPMNKDGFINLKDSQFYQRLDELTSLNTLPTSSSPSSGPLNSNEATNSNNSGEFIASAKTYCITDDQIQIPMRATIIKTINTRNEYTGFSLILTDLRESFQQKKKLLEVRAHCETLIKEMVPRGTFNFIKGQSGPVVFRSDSAILMAAEIVGMEGIIDSLPPRELLMDVQKVCQTIEETTDNFDSIKLIRNEHDLIFATGGLFDHFGEFEYLTKNMVDFSFEIMRRVEELNETINTDLHLKIGIHKSRQIVGYVMNPEVPDFRIMSKGVNVVLQVERRSVTDTVHITESAFQYLNKDEFDHDEVQIIEFSNTKRISVFEITPRSVDGYMAVGTDEIEFDEEKDGLMVPT